MIVFKPNNLVDEDKLNKKEAIPFIIFLQEEKVRHMLAYNIADANRYTARNIPILQEVYKSSMLRHMDDIRMIDNTITKLIYKFNITIEELLRWI